MSSFKDGPSLRYYLESNKSDTAEETLDGTGFVDTVKISHVTNVTIGNKKINGGSEDCIDIVGGKDITIRDCKLDILSKNGITIKGASDGVFFYGLEFYEQGNETDIVIGDFDNYWYPGRPPAKNIMFSGPIGDSPVRIKLIDADTPYCLGFYSSIERVPKWKWLPYFYYRYYSIKVMNLFGAKIDNSRYLPGGLETA